MTTTKKIAIARRLVLSGELPKYLDAARVIKTVEDFDIILDAHARGADAYGIASEHGFELDAVEAVLAAFLKKDHLFS